MSKTLTVVLALVVGLAAGILLGNRLMTPGAEAQTGRTTITSFSAVPDAIGAQDISGPYEVVEGWPKNLSTLPGHEKWTYGGARGIFAPGRGGDCAARLARRRHRALGQVRADTQLRGLR